MVIVLIFFLELQIITLSSSVCSKMVCSEGPAMEAKVGATAVYF